MKKMTNDELDKCRTIGTDTRIDLDVREAVEKLIAAYLDARGELNAHEYYSTRR